MFPHLLSLGRLRRVRRSDVPARMPARLLADMGLAEAATPEPRRAPPLARWPLLPGAILRS